MSIPNIAFECGFAGRPRGFERGLSLNWGTYRV
jgi:hypothetical protein